MSKLKTNTPLGLGFALAFALYAGGCTDSSRMGESVVPPSESTHAAPADRPIGTPANNVLSDLLAVEETAKRLSAQVYTPDVSGWRRALGGGERASQTIKANDTYQEVYEKELRRAAFRHGLSYEAAVALLREHHSGQRPKS